MDIISTHGLTKYYGKNRGIIDLDLNVREGEIYGFIGPNGAGKSTTIKLLLDFIRPTSGNAKIFGKDAVLNTRQIKKEIGYIPADVNYYDDMKVSDLLKYSAAFYPGDYRERSAKLCEALDLDPLRKIEELSTGNKKKVAIAQALLHEPKLIIMDEPTSGLDPLIQNAFYSLVKEARDGGATVFFSSHVLSEVQRICDRVGIIREGRLIKVERIEELSKTQYKKVRIAMKGDLKLIGAENMTRRNGHIEFMYRGSANSLIHALHGQDIKNIWVEDPPLEDIFMAYYTEGDK